jgi:hypothetical protein
MGGVSQVTCWQGENAEKNLNHNLREVRKPVIVLMVVMVKNGKEIFVMVTESMDEIGAGKK